ncbi:unnamed protein product [Lampetra fluviatilis]
MKTTMEFTSGMCGACQLPNAGALSGGAAQRRWGCVLLLDASGDSSLERLSRSSPHSGFGGASAGWPTGGGGGCCVIGGGGGGGGGGC